MEGYLTESLLGGRLFDSRIIDRRLSDTGLTDARLNDNTRSLTEITYFPSHCHIC